MGYDFSKYSSLGIVLCLSLLCGVTGKGYAGFGIVDPSALHLRSVSQPNMDKPKKGSPTNSSALQVLAAPKPSKALTGSWKNFHCFSNDNIE